MGMSHRQEKRTTDEGKEDLSYLNLKLLGQVLTYAIVIMIALGLVFLGGIIIWVMRHILGV
ncbi:MAG: hypothetical protein QW828_03975 [Candidatus Bathyarchaeia archaeon]